MKKCLAWIVLIVLAAAAIAAAELPASVRGERLALADFARLADALSETINNM